MSKTALTSKISFNKLENSYICLANRQAEEEYETALCPNIQCSRFLGCFVIVMWFWCLSFIVCEFVLTWLVAGCCLLMDWLKEGYSITVSWF